MNVGPRGVRSTVGIPGTGLSYSHHHTSPGPEVGGPSFSPSPAPRYDYGSPTPQPFYAQAQAYQMREINSAAVEQLTSHSLLELRDLISQARSQRGEIEADLREAEAQLCQDEQDLARRQSSLFRFFYKKRIAELEEGVPQTAAEVERLRGWLASTHIDMQFETSDAAKRAYGSLVRAFEVLRGSAAIWDITSDRHGDRVIERSYASRTITRHRVALDYSATDLVRFDGQAMRFENVNGEAILIYPGMVLMPRADGAFALIDLREIRLEFAATQFVEDEAVPSDSQVVHYTWAKVNKDGTPDRRFRDNYQIPVCLYGRLMFASPGGVQEEYQFSNVNAAGEFARAFDAYQAALSA